MENILFFVHTQADWNILPSAVYSLTVAQVINSTLTELLVRKKTSRENHLNECDGRKHAALSMQSAGEVMVVFLNWTPHLNFTSCSFYYHVFVCYLHYKIQSSQFNHQNNTERQTGLRCSPHLAHRSDNISQSMMGTLSPPTAPDP